MKRGDIWRDPILPGSVFAWIFVALFLVIPAIFARYEPLALVATFGAGALAFSPEESRPRKVGLILSPLAWIASLVPVLAVSIPWKVALFFGPLAIVATDIARQEGVGLPILRFLRSPRVQGWAGLLCLTPLVIFSLFAIHDSLAKSGLPPTWSWSLLPLALVAIAPSSWFGPWRAAWGALPFGAAFIYAGAHPKDKSGELILQAGFAAFQTLMFAEWAHAAWTKLRPNRGEPEDTESRPIRVHTGAGLP